MLSHACRCIFLAALAAFPLISPEAAQPKMADRLELTTPTSPLPQTSGRAIQALISEVDRAEAACLVERSRTAGEDSWRTYSELNHVAVPQVLDLVRKDPTSRDAFLALKWIINNRQVAAGDRQLSVFGTSAVALVLAHHSIDPQIATIFASLSDGWNLGDLSSVALLEAVAKKHPDRSARGQAIFALGVLNKLSAEWLEGAERMIAQDPAAERTLPPLYSVLLSRGNVKVQKAEAAALFETVINRYSEVASLSRVRIRRSPATIGDEARCELFEMTRLGVGCVAPEIEGVDLEGRTLRLGDFRGRIVLLTFWASWCGPCMELVKHERELSKRFASKRFAVVGVNGDKSVGDALNAVKTSGISWGSFWSGSEGPNGPIPTIWNVHGWPTCYVLDGEGVIRLRDTTLSPLIEKTVAQLLAENDHGK